VDARQLLIDLHRGASRQGPGGDAETEKAIDLAYIDRRVPLKIADIGCGTGSATLVLARLLNARITAVDLLQDFLDVLEARARTAGVAENITALCASMADLPFGDEEFDVIWSEGAIYNIGFKRGVADWKRYLRPGGLLIVSEISWMTDSRPAEIQNHWESEYPEIDVASSNLKVLEEQGYSPIGYFVLPEHCWLDNYYLPMQDSFPDFLDRNGNSEAARAIVEAETKEIELYDRYKSHYGYGVYIARKVGWKNP
jgi:SAM-dependent methyltransferase